MIRKNPLLNVNGLCVDFDTRDGRVRVLHDIDLSLQHGQALGIVGESGCGKSMTALAIMRLVPAPAGRIAKGSVHLEDRDLTGLPEKEMQDVRGNEIAMIFQEPMTSLNPVFSVGNQIAESIRRHQNVSAREASNRVVEMLREVGVPAAEHRMRMYPHELSGGLRQRVMIAMALSCRPRVLIADEPTTALDVTVQAQIFDLLQDIREKTGTAIMLITHDMAVISETTQRVAVMYAGSKVEEGDVRSIIDRPRHPYTRGLLRCVPHLLDDPGDVRRELMEIPGVVPNMSRLGPGCAFGQRCPHFTGQCGHERPPMTAEQGQDHQVACWHAGEIS